MNKQAITEEQGVHKQWYEEAEKQTPDTLPAFMARLSEEYEHDYGTFVHMVAACAIGAAWAVGTGLSGFQGGAVMWQFVREWQYSENKCGLKIINYDNVLYPQYEGDFLGQTLTSSTWAAIRKEAAAKLQADAELAHEHVGKMAAYEQAIAAFRLAYPDYDERPDYYLPLSSGTGSQWEVERVKEESGFDFAPREPYLATAAPRVAAHWQSIVAGKAPFNMRLTKD